MNGSLANEDSTQPSLCKEKNHQNTNTKYSNKTKSSSDIEVSFFNRRSRSHSCNQTSEDERNASGNELTSKHIFSRYKRGSLWSLFRGKKGTKHWDFPTPVSHDDITKRHFCKSVSTPNVFPQVVAIDQPDKDSGLGDSISSTPVSTISSTGHVEIPGIVGMHNLGNTCYFNSVLQCLAHVDVFGEYFAMDNYMDDISSATLPATKKYKNKSTCHNNNKGELTYMLALMIKSLWHADLYTIDVARELHEVIGQYERQYSGAEEQDAQEFLMWLINKVHEESVRAPRKKQKDLLKKKKTNSEEEQAVLAFASFTQYHQSYIQGLFLSQYRSSIACSNCKQLSNTFDPYTCVSLSIPQPQTMTITITLIYSSQTISPLKVAFIFERTASINELKQKISRKHSFKNFLLTELQYDGLYKFLLNENPIGTLSKLEDTIYALEVGDEFYAETHQNEELSDKSQCSTISNLVLIISNVEVYGKEYRRFGCPMVINVTKDLSFKQIQVIIRKNMAPNIRNALNKVIKEKQVKLGLHIIDGKPGSKHFLSNDLQHPLQSDVVLKSIFQDKEVDLQYLFLVAEWEPIPSAWYMNNIGITLGTEDESVKEIRLKKLEIPVIDLEDCLKLQTQEEKLADKWKCPFCRTEQHGVVKKLTLWSLPDILVLHLKRFDQLQGFNEKISSHVTFPINGLNMSPYVATASTKVASKLYRKESLKLSYQPPPQTEDHCLYDLKAVCNHHGSHINSGHYTASCYNSVNGNWYNFDDRSVRCIDEKEIVTTGSYLLFYEKRCLSSRIPNGTFMSLSRARSSPDHHWSYKIHRPHTLPAGLHFVQREDNIGY